MKLNELGVGDAAKVGAGLVGSALGYDKGRKNAEKILARNNFANNFVKTVLANIKAQGVEVKPTKSTASVATPGSTTEPATTTTTPATEPTTSAATTAATSPADDFAARRIAKQKAAQAALDKAGGQFSKVDIQPKTPEEIRKEKQAAAAANLNMTPKPVRGNDAGARARAALAAKRPKLKEDLSNLEEALSSVLEDGPGLSMEEFLKNYIPQYMSGYDITPFANKIEPLVRKVANNPSKATLRELGGVLYDIASESERKGLYSRMGGKTPSASTAGEFSEPVGVGKDMFVKGPDGWVSAKDKKTPANKTDIPMLEKLLAAAAKAGGAAPEMSGIGKLALDNVKQLNKLDHADDLEEIIKVGLNKLYGISKEQYANLLGQIKK